MTYRPAPRSTRLRYVGVLESADGCYVYWRMEHNFGPAGWIANGPVLSGFIPRHAMASTTWENILAGCHESGAAYERAEMERLAQDPLF